MESSILLRKTISSSPNVGHGGKGALRALFSYGEKDYYLGGSPVWELFRVGYRMTKKPAFTGGLALLCGYCWAAMRRMKRAVTPGANAISSTGTDEKVESDFCYPSKIQEGRQLSP